MKYPDLYTPEELYPGTWKMHIYHSDHRLLLQALNPGVPFVWLHNFSFGGLEWGMHSFPIFDGQSEVALFTREFELDLIIPTERFIDVLPELGDKHLHVIQLYEKPPYFLKLDKVSGMPKYELLKRSGYYFEYRDGKGKDLGEIVSNNEEFWEGIQASREEISS